MHISYALQTLPSGIKRLNNLLDQTRFTVPNAFSKFLLAENTMQSHRSHNFSLWRMRVLRCDEKKRKSLQ